MLVLSYKKQGLIASSIIQCALLSYVFLDAGELFLEQMAFSLSVYTALWATYLVQDEEQVDQKVESSDAREQKETLWQELFSARQEITELYREKTELEEKLAVVDRKKLDTLSEIEQKIGVLEAEKSDLLEDKVQQEADIAKLLDDLLEMGARYDAAVNKKAPLQPFEAMYKQLKGQFDEKSVILDQTRKELFHAQEEVEVLKRRLEFEQDCPSDAEKALHLQLKATTEKLDSLEKKHEEELVGYEEVIGRLLQQLNQGQ